MSRKTKLIGSIAVLVLLCFMIPIAIFASTKQTMQVANNLKFNVNDIECDFYLGLIGNKKSESTTGDIGTISQVDNKNVLTPKKIFKSVYDGDTKSYKVYYTFDDPNGEETTQQTISPKKPFDVEFQSKATPVTYYFVFINTATETEFGDRSVNLRTSTDKGDNFSQIIATKWSYSTGTISFNDYPTTSFVLPSTWVDATASSGNFEENIKVNARKTNELVYHYIIFKFTMNLINDSQPATTDLTLTIYMDHITI